MAQRIKGTVQGERTSLPISHFSVPSFSRTLVTDDAKNKRVGLINYIRFNLRHTTIIKYVYRSQVDYLRRKTQDRQSTFNSCPPAIYEDERGEEDGEDRVQPVARQELRLIRRQFPRIIHQGGRRLGWTQLYGDARRLGRWGLGLFHHSLQLLRYVGYV